MVLRFVAIAALILRTTTAAAMHFDVTLVQLVGFSLSHSPFHPTLKTLLSNPFSISLSPTWGVTN